MPIFFSNAKIIFQRRTWATFVFPKQTYDSKLGEKAPYGLLFKCPLNKFYVTLYVQSCTQRVLHLPWWRTVYTSTTNGRVALLRTNNQDRERLNRNLFIAWEYTIISRWWIYNHRLDSFLKQKPESWNLR